MRHPVHAKRLAEMDRDAKVFAQWGDFQLTIAHTLDAVPSGKVLGGLMLELEHLREEGGNPTFLETVYLPEPVMDDLARMWLRYRAGRGALATRLGDKPQH